MGVQKRSSGRFNSDIESKSQREVSERKRNLSDGAEFGGEVLALATLVDQLHFAGVQTLLEFGQIFDQPVHGLVFEARRRPVDSRLRVGRKPVDRVVLFAPLQRKRIVSFFSFLFLLECSQPVLIVLRLG